MDRKTRQLSLGGVLCALCVSVLFIGSFIPLSIGISLLVSGFCIMLIVAETGMRFGAAAYIAVSLISFFILPDLLRTFAFATAFGVYPLIKHLIERLPGRALSYACKGITFTLLVALNLAVSIHVMGIPVGVDFLFLGQFGAMAAVFALQVAVFVAYDLSLTTLYSRYIVRWRSRLLKGGL